MQREFFIQRDGEKIFHSEEGIENFFIETDSKRFLVVRNFSKALKIGFISFDSNIKTLKKAVENSNIFV